MSAKLTSRVAAPAELEPNEILAWERICASVPNYRSPFYSPHFARAVASVRPGVRVCVLQRDGAPVGFLPFQYTSSWGRFLAAAEPVGNPMADYFGLIAESDVHLDAQDLLKHSGLSYLGFTHLDETQLSIGLAGEQPQGGLRIQLGDGQEYWTQLRTVKKSFMSDTVRRQKKLESTYGPLRFCFQDADPVSALRHLVNMKRLQYKSTGVNDPLVPQWTRDLLEVLASTGYATCSGVVSTLYAGDTWVASHCGLRSGHVLHYWFPVYNPDLREFAPGRLLLKCVCEAADGQGVHCIDRGAGESQAKRDLANDSHQFYRGAWFRPGTKAVAVRVLSSLKWRLAPSEKPVRSASAL